MILIADGGSTKTTWCLIDKNKQASFFETEGYNPYFVDSEYITRSLQISLPPDMTWEDILEVNYYGAGCFPAKIPVMQSALEAIFKNAAVYVELDLVGAARGLLGDGSGFVAILGTGSNTCLFTEGKIAHYIDSLGYLLGDEGSGCDIGKRLLADYARGYLPKEIEDRFLETYRITPPEVIDRVYSEPLVNRFCADFCTFIGQHIDNNYLHNMVRVSFHSFFNNLVSRYPGYKNYSFNCVGSVGYTFKDILQETATSFNMPFGHIIQSPIEGLATYYTQKII